MALTWVEINKANLIHNIQQFKNVIPTAELWPVIKSNAYGHGFKEIAEILDRDKNTTGFMVVNLTEALELSKITSKPIMVLSYFDQEEGSLVIAAERKISLPLYDLTTADYLDNLSKRIKKKFLVNIKIDTGTSRLGFRAEEAVQNIQEIKKKEGLIINTLFTHYAESESENQTFTTQQLDIFNRITSQFPEIKKHSACSAAILSNTESQMDIVRLGLSLYGLWPSEATKRRGMMLKMTLKPILAWYTSIIQIRQLKKGESVGYNRNYVAQHDSCLAILPVGYNEGYDRLLSNKAVVAIKGKKYPVRGNICMNLMMIELPGQTDIKVGDKVELLGDKIRAEDLAEKAQTINYEIVTRINSKITRLVI